MSSNEKMYNLFKAINVNILNKKEENNGLSFIDHYYYQMTSYAISLIDELELDIEPSIATIEMYKSFIETVSIVSMYTKEDSINDDDSTEPLNDYNYIQELNLYNKYKDTLGTKYFHFNDLKKNNKSLDEIYKELPFLAPGFNYRNLIEKYNPELLAYYDKIINNKLDNAGMLNAVILMIAYMICKQKFFNIEIKYKNTLEYSKSFFINHPLSQRYLNYVNTEANILKETNNPDLIEAAKLVSTLAIDKVFLFSETLETKTKATFEYLNKLYNKVTGKNTDFDEFSDIMTDDKLTEYIRMIYDESVNLSHASGYMILSSIDVYQEYSEIISFVDNVLCSILNLLGFDNKEFKQIIKEKNKFDFEHRYLVDKKEE